MTRDMWGLRTFPALERPDLLAEPVAAALREWRHPTPVDEVLAAPIDPDLAGTEECCAAYGIPADVSANCVVVAAKRGGRTRFAACIVLATTRLDVNGAVRRRMDARKASFAPQEDAVGESGMEYGGITPVGLARTGAAEWPVLVDEAVVERPHVVVGSGVRRSKLVLPGAAVAELPHAEIMAGLGRPAG